jgi:hypothetical protein
MLIEGFFMNKNNFFMAMVFGIITLLGTSFELRSSEYVIGGSVIIGAGLLVGTQTATYQTFRKDQARRAEEKEKAENPLRYAEPLSEKRSSSETPVISEKVQAFLNNYEKERRAEAQKCATKITSETLPSHIIDDYAGEHRK